ncbi:hypothetical protein IE53DRAFT_390805 [Violaceomyces palustris]|uniref:Uncharacterized protein n=1 Tax=Violaceomyces palustris TaxID=1673888 RepID=A0ACD0NMQ7_9BASI|nr:hypothetical protein IE53DRAFT_390805 [Violaceomyces palustris]
MADSETPAAPEITLNVKGPSELKLSLTIATDQTVRQLKEKIEKERSDFGADSQRLIYSGKVLKDEEQLSIYKVQSGHTIHMVRSAARSAPTTGNPATAGTAPTTTSASSTNASAAQGVPSNFAAGQNFNSDPLSALNRADLAGPHMARLLNNSGGMFGEMGLNPRDPNMMMGMMQSPEFMRHMREMLARPEVVEQIIASNPQMQAMAPQVREMLRSEQFREFLTNPEALQRMAQMSQLFNGGAGGGVGGGIGAGNPFGGFGGFGSGAAQFPPAGAFGSTTANTSAGNQAARDGGAGAGTGAGAIGGGNNATPADPFAAALAALGGGSGAGAGPSPFGDPALLQQLLGLSSPGAGQGVGGGAGAGAGPFNPWAALGGGFQTAQQARDTRPPEERFSTQLEQMQAMGFYDGQANVRALLLSGGSVEGAIGILLDNPNPPASQ